MATKLITWKEMICLDQGQIRETSYFSACCASLFISHLLELMLIQDKLIQADVFFLLLETHMLYFCVSVSRRDDGSLREHHQDL